MTYRPQDDVSQHFETASLAPEHRRSIAPGPLFSSCLLLLCLGCGQAHATSSQDTGTPAARAAAATPAPLASVSSAPTMASASGAAITQASAAVVASASTAPAASIAPTQRAGKPAPAMLKSSEAHAWAKSAHATFEKPLPKASKAASTVTDSAVPTISAIAATPTTVHSGDTVRWDVHTSPNVVSVAAHVTLATLQLQRAAPGHFTLAFVIPANTPGIFHGSYNVDIVAKASDGDTVTKTISMTFV